MQFVNILEIPLMRFLSISEMEFVAPESRLKQQEAITTTTVKRITATEHPELRKQLQTCPSPKLEPLPTPPDWKPKRSLLAELLHVATPEAAAALAPSSSLYAVGL